jgi:BMFP domain-containing protein YqiC
MQTDNRILDDLAKVANGALSTLSGVREEVETRVRERVERLLSEMDLVPREEFEAVRAMAQKARAEQESLSERVSTLEQRIEALEGAKRRAPAKKRSGKSDADEGGDEAAEAST